MRQLPSLRMRIKLLLTLLAAASVLVCVVVFAVAGQHVFNRQAISLLDQTERTFARVFGDFDERAIRRSQRLATGLNVTDLALLQQQLEDVRVRRKAPFVVYYDTEQQVLVGDARINQLLQPVWSTVWAQARLDGAALAHATLLDQLYSVVVVSVAQPNQPEGWLSIAYPVDDAVALDLQERIGMDVSLVLQPTPDARVVVASSLPAASRADLLSAPVLQAQQIQLADTAYQSRMLALPNSAAATPASQRVSVLLQYPSSRVFAPLYDLTKIMLVLALLSFVLIGLASFVIARMVTRPLHDLVSAARQIQHGDYQQKIAPPKTLELAELAQSLTHMQVAIHERELRVLALAEKDVLTGVYNRVGFLRRVESLLSQQRPMTAILINIDRFQQINDTLGHPFGDQVLIAFADQLVQLLAAVPDAVLARFGGDEFAALVPMDQPDWAGLVDRMQHQFELPLQVTERQLDVRATVGIAHCPLHAKNAVDLMCCADEAMYIAKEERIGCRVYNPERQRFRTEHLSLLGELKAALASDQLMLYFQPKICLQPSKNQDQPVLHQAEALIRWQHPERGFIPPSEFIPFAEQTSDIRDLTRWVIAEGCTNAAKLGEQGHAVRVSVNISVRDLLDGQFYLYVRECLAEANIPPSRLCLEITESGAMEEAPAVLDNLNQLKQMGVAMAIDDYGTGYSSLSYVRQLPVSELKIDQSFIKHMIDSPNDMMIVRSTIELAHSLGFSVVAEGVETQQISQLLVDFGCDSAQGYFYARPLPFADYTTWLVQRPH